MKYHKDNPRFVLTVGCYTEAFPDIPTELGLTIYDRQERHTVVAFHPAYAQLLCLEQSHRAEAMPFSNLEAWLNSLKNAALASEGVPSTR